MANNFLLVPGMLMGGGQLKLGSWTYDGFHLNLTEYSPGEGLHLGDMNMNSRYLITRQQPDPVKARRSHNIMKIIGQRQLSYLIVVSDSTVGCRLSTTAAALSPT